MIAYLRGLLLEKTPGTIIVFCSGVGYEVHIPISTFSALPNQGEETSLRIYTQVREDAITLYGFATVEEKTAFEKLISVSGIGPALAAKVLSGTSVENLAACIRSGDTASLVKVPGVGKKTAERIVLELKDKLEGLPIGAGALRPPSATDSFSPLELDVLSALMNLGSTRPLAEQAVTKAKTSVKGANFEELFRKALELVR